MSQDYRNRTYYSAKSRHLMLVAAAAALEAALNSVMEDSGAKFRISEMLQRCRDEVDQAVGIVERAEKDL